MRPTIEGDAGTTLVEVLVAVVVLGTAGVAVIGGMYTSVAVSDVHRKQATAAAVAADYTERIAGLGYAECAGPAAYQLAPSAVPVPGGYTADVASVEYWNAASGSWAGSCTSSGLQRVTVVASSADGRATERSAVVVRQR